MDQLIFDDRVCAIGEGPLWHPERQQLYWFDIIGSRLLTRENGAARHWQFDEHVSAAGWLDGDSLIKASETGLHLFNLTTGNSELVVSIEADNAQTRSNDGRGDPWGGFWIGTMGKNAEKGAGAIYRYYRGEVRLLFSDITVSNSICFAPDGRCAYFSDTDKHTIWRQPLEEKHGWPKGDHSIYLDLTAEARRPDGAVIDKDGYLWSAQWGSSRVARYDPAGKLDIVLPFPATQTSCPAFGGADLTDLYVTSAAIRLSAEALQKQASEGMTFLTKTAFTGQAEHRVIL